MLFKVLIPCLLVMACARPQYFQEGAPHGVKSTSGLKCAATFAKSGHCVDWYWEVEPTASLEGSLVFKVFRPNLLDQSPVLQDLNETAHVELWMPDMGHGSTESSTERVDQGTYRAKEVFFVMPGLWEIRFQSRQGETTVDQAIVRVEI